MLIFAWSKAASRASDENRRPQLGHTRVLSGDVAICPESDIFPIRTAQEQFGRGRDIFGASACKSVIARAAATCAICDGSLLISRSGSIAPLSPSCPNAHAADARTHSLLSLSVFRRASI